MSKKHIFIIVDIILCICIVATVIHFRMKYDEKEGQKTIYYKEQQARIILYLKHNTREPSTIRPIHFTKLETSPMGSAATEGYINENRRDDSVTYASPENNFQFVGGIILSEDLSEIIKMKAKSPDEIKEELDKKEGR